MKYEENAAVDFECHGISWACMPESEIQNVFVGEGEKAHLFHALVYSHIRPTNDYRIDGFWFPSVLRSSKHRSLQPCAHCHNA